MNQQAISPAFPYESQYLQVLGSNIHYIEEGTGDPILFLHGNPTSNYLWRNIIPYLSKQGRCIAPDLIGMGKSDKPDVAYGFHDTYQYVEGFIEKMGLKNITLVLHDWGSGMGFHYANLHRANIKAIAFMEAMYDAPTMYDMPFSVKMALRMVRNPLFGKLMVQVGNVFIKQMLPDMIVRDLTTEEKAHYAEPYPTFQSRKPLLAWPQDVPFSDGKATAATPAVQSWAPWLAESEIPKLCLYVTPGVAIKEKDVKIIEDTFRNTEMIHLGEGLHFIQEDYPHEIGHVISEWYDRVK
ncbi:haloalkane dehalogenase [Pontibacter sp. G13]|uniref:haloalkane dehalogenase n=1 Tax=Pontibacter sp. G13 TaxID=3074898 RepID=UPI00288A43EA|nr:haloalkane dehalogenase [Pontibacter sp. G13]WNJ17501.1 haloalkane dehalogenase [Pontibacter sp. G13]